MSDELRELYQELLLDHGKRPRNFGTLAGATHTAEGFNPLCGDRVMVAIAIDDEDDQRLREVRFTGQGCAICMASASLMTEAVKGKPRDEAIELFEEATASLTGRESIESDDPRLAALSGVRRYPVRVKCATLPWHTLRAALRSERSGVTTE